MENGKMFHLALAASAIVLPGVHSVAGTITIEQRESSAGNVMWAGSAGASQTSNESDTTK